MTKNKETVAATKSIDIEDLTAEQAQERDMDKLADRVIAKGCPQIAEAVNDRLTKAGKEASFFDRDLLKFGTSVAGAIGFVKLVEWGIEKVVGGATEDQISEQTSNAICDDVLGSMFD